MASSEPKPLNISGNVQLNPLGLLKGLSETAPKSAVFGKESSVMRGGAMRLEESVSQRFILEFMTRLLPLTLICGSLLLSADWPRFRGPNGAGVDEASVGLPAEFGPSKNVAWKSPVPFGKSSPVVAGGRVFLTAAKAICC